MRINQIILIGIALIFLGLLSAPLGLSLAWLRSFDPRRGSAVYHRRSTANRPTVEDTEPGTAIRLRHRQSPGNKPVPRVRRMP
jgi:hypothetical protein